eukprot:6181211-Pleurochrysis_carterae.AAC.4
MSRSQRQSQRLSAAAVLLVLIHEVIQHPLRWPYGLTSSQGTLTCKPCEMLERQFMMYQDEKCWLLYTRSCVNTECCTRRGQSSHFCKAGRIANGRHTRVLEFASLVLQPDYKSYGGSHRTQSITRHEGLHDEQYYQYHVLDLKQPLASTVRYNVMHYCDIVER